MQEVEVVRIYNVREDEHITIFFYITYSTMLSAASSLYKCL